MSGVSQGESVSTVDGDGLLWDSVSTAFSGVSWETGSIFSPIDLFFYGEEGAWYDPSDLTTMFQDSVGTTPVTVDGQPVGLILDKSKGLLLGTELTVNGDFSSGSTGWSATGGNTTTFTGGVCTVVGTGNSGPFQDITTTPGKYYLITYTALITSGACNPSVYEGGGFAVSIADSGGVAPGALCFKATTATSRIYFPCYSTPNITLDNISVKELPGNHASQTTTAARPLYKTDGTYHWLQFDGVDDSLSTAAIDFTGTDKMSAFTGFRYSESGPKRPFATTPQGFEFRISYTGVGQIDMSHDLSGAEAEGGMRSNPTTFPQNTKTVFSTVINGSGTTWQTETPVGRVNGTQVLNNAFGVSNQTGNFPSATLSMSHGGTCPCYIYSLIVRGALSTTQEITDTETWVNSKTGAY